MLCPCTDFSHKPYSFYCVIFAKDIEFRAASVAPVQAKCLIKLPSVALRRVPASHPYVIKLEES